jgi:hypothetical protein
MELLAPSVSVTPAGALGDACVASCLPGKGVDPNHEVNDVKNVRLTACLPGGRSSAMGVVSGVDRALWGAWALAWVSVGPSAMDARLEGE